MIVIGTRPPELPTFPSDPDPEDPYPSDGDNGGDGGGGSEPPPAEPSPACAVFEQAARDAGCDLQHPPTLAVNGCGAAGSLDFFPDFLVLAPGIGGLNLFTGACNTHDVCYGTFPGAKRSCDDALQVDMLEACDMTFTPLEKTLHGNACFFQAVSYAQGLQSMAIEAMGSIAAFNAGQAEGICRALSKAAEEEQCP